MSNRNGWLVEEYIAVSEHHFEDGQIDARLHDDSDGTYTGVFWFEYADGKRTRRYTTKTAPKWLLSYYELATIGKGEAVTE